MTNTPIDFVYEKKVTNIAIDDVSEEKVANIAIDDASEEKVTNIAVVGPKWQSDYLYKRSGEFECTWDSFCPRASRHEPTSQGSLYVHRVGLSIYF